MIDPVIFTIGNFSLRWYGVIVMIGVIVGSLLIENELKRKGENSDSIWDALVLILPVGILGARLWFVMNATAGGNRYYIDNPFAPITIDLFGLIKPFTFLFPTSLMVWEGGLHIYGGLLLGAIALVYYLRKNNLDTWLFFDIAGPALLIGQGIGRIANFINQELYGPPTTLPWGIPIELAHRLPDFRALPETTRFHPTFAYEMLWNFAAAGLLLWLYRRYEKELKPGTLFAGWLMLAGVGRIWIEFFRPDQPKIGDSFVSYSMLAATLMAVAGTILLLVRYKVFNPSFAEGWENEYQISTKTQAKVVAQPKPAKLGAKSAPRAGGVKKAAVRKSAARITKRTKAPRTPTKPRPKAPVRRKKTS